MAMLAGADERGVEEQRSRCGVKANHERHAGDRRVRQRLRQGRPDRETRSDLGG
jgi:hypothetical protein